MSQNPQDTSNNKKKKPKNAPPDERFWVKYSQHHEFPLSTASSVFLHALVVGIVVLGAAIVARGFGDRPPEVSPLLVEGGGGGNPDGIGKAPNTGVLPAGQEQTEQVKNLQQPLPEQPQEQLVKPNIKPPDVDIKPSEDDRLINVDAAVLRELTDVGKAARQRLEGAIAGKGQGGSGKGGGKGAGTGEGTGNKEGVGSGKMSQRQKRQLRWVMMFNTLNGNDYANQLQGLGAILAVQQADGRYYVIRDLVRRPAPGKIEDPPLERIYWIDDKPGSVQSLGQALGIVPAPSHVIAFFPKELEDDLLKKELAHFRKLNPSGGEDQIQETRFTVMRRGARYEPIISSQR